MIKKGKNINMFLVDGEVTGVIKCTLSNWIGVVYKIPRSKLTDEKVRNRPELKQSGIYFLIGKDEKTDNPTVYIGQASVRKNGEGVLLRVLEHTRDNHSEYFSEVIILTTQNNFFGPTEISYLEHKFTNLTKEVNRYTVRNTNEPSIGHVTEEKESELDEVIENTKIIIGTLGHRLFVPMLQAKEVEKTPVSEIDSVFYLTRKMKQSQRVIQATCQQTEEGFVVLKGSMVEEYDAKSLPYSVKKIRTQLKASGKILNGILEENVLFNSPSYASVFVLGMASNGRTDWKNAKGVTLKELEEENVNHNER